MLRILLVEDEMLLSLSASLALEDAGYHVTVASDGRQGLEVALQNPPEVIVTDFMMPRMDGLEMIRALRDAGYGGPVILATAVSEENLPDGSTKYDRFLPKPYHEEELLAAVRACHTDADQPG